MDNKYLALTKSHRDMFTFPTSNLPARTEIRSICDPRIIGRFSPEWKEKTSLTYGSDIVGEGCVIPRPAARAFHATYRPFFANICRRNENLFFFHLVVSLPSRLLSSFDRERSDISFDSLCTICAPNLLPTLNFDVLPRGLAH